MHVGLLGNRGLDSLVPPLTATPIALPGRIAQASQAYALAAATDPEDESQPHPELSFRMPSSQGGFNQVDQGHENILGQIAIAAEAAAASHLLADVRGGRAGGGGSRPEAKFGGRARGEGGEAVEKHSIAADETAAAAGERWERGEGPSPGPLGDDNGARGGAGARGSRGRGGGEAGGGQSSRLACLLNAVPVSLLPPGRPPAQDSRSRSKPLLAQQQQQKKRRTSVLYDAPPVAVSFSRNQR